MYFIVHNTRECSYHRKKGTEQLITVDKCYGNRTIL